MARPEDPTRRRKLVAVAARLFRRNGYAHTTTRDIARALKVQPGSIFYHFSSKEDLLTEVMHEGMQPFVTMVRSPALRAGAPLDRLRALLHGHLRILHGAGDEQAVVVQEWDRVPAHVRRRVIPLRDEVEAVWRQVLEGCADAGLVHGDTRILRLSLLGALNWTLQWYRPRGELSVDQLAERVLALLAPALAARGRQPRNAARAAAR